MTFPRRRTRWLLLALLASAVVVALPGARQAAAATTLRVPQDFPTIQAAIDAAVAGDTVSVSPGTYVERIDYQQKAITVESTDGPATTIIDGNQAGGVVRIVANAGETPVLRGFTIRNGTDPFFGDGAGISTTGGPALIEGNRVTGNAGCAGSGIAAEFSSATIRGNVVSGNHPSGCSGGTGGGGILIGGDGTVKVLGNTITGNATAADGGGISLFAAGTPTISGNVISGNTAEVGRNGGGISLLNASDALITNNFISGNTGAEGGGIYWLVPSGQPGPNVVDNTIADNSAGRGSALFPDGFDAATQVTNNVLVGSGAAAVVDCGDFNDPNPPVIAFNDVFNAGSGTAYGGICSDQTGQNGNISADPRFVDPATGNYHLRAGSPAIDAGRNDGAPATDIDGDQRPIDGNGDGVAVVDMGADEARAGGDTTPPTITCTASPNTLTPPNHKLRQVSVGIAASDDSGSVTVTLVSVTSSQPDSGLGRDDVPKDIQGWTAGTDDRSGLLRAERFRTTRVYTLTYRASDPAGNTATCSTTVKVPR
ncbi:MAG TPA: right-handed parallel beta-helix repeat-containing protein [Actinomycetes bacterium]